MTPTIRRYPPRFHLTRMTADGRFTGYWSKFGDFREEPDFLKHFDQWFEWARHKAERRLAELKNAKDAASP